LAAGGDKSAGQRIWSSALPTPRRGEPQGRGETNLSTNPAEGGIKSSPLFSVAPLTPPRPCANVPVKPVTETIMRFTTKDLDWAVGENIIAPEVRTALVAALEARYEHTPSLSFGNVLYYLGGLIIIGSMTLFVSTAWEALGAAGHLAVALAYAAVFLAAGGWLWHAKGQRIPGGILVTAAVSMTPMAVWAVQNLLGWWIYDDPGAYRDFYIWIKNGWGIMEIATVLSGCLAIRFFRFPFITLPVAFALWFLSMDLTAMLYGHEFSWDQRKIVSLWFGLAMLVASFIVDRRTREDFAFWGYLFGMLAFWGALSAMDSNSELSRFLYCLINLGLMLVSVLLQRRVFIIFGALGVTGYLGHLASSVFRDQIAFSFALSALGLAIIFLGILYRRHREGLERLLMGILPDAVRRALPMNRE